MMMNAMRLAVGAAVVAIAGTAFLWLTLPCWSWMLGDGTVGISCGGATPFVCSPRLVGARACVRVGQ